MPTSTCYNFFWVRSSNNFASFSFKKQNLRIYHLEFDVFFYLQAMGNTQRLIFTLIIHPICQFMPMLPLHRNRSNDLQGKSKGWLLYNGKNASPSHYLFDIIFLT